MNMVEEKSRKERRKEVRLLKKKDRFSSWIQHQKSFKEKTVISNSKPPAIEHPEKDSCFVSNRDRNLNEVDNKSMKKSKRKLDSVTAATASVVKEKRGLKRKSKKTKFEEYVEMEMKSSVVSAEEDLEMERRLAKKLKVKSGKLRGLDDGMNLLFDGTPSVIDDEILDAEEEVSGNVNGLRSSSKKQKKRKLLDASSTKEGGKDNVVSDDTAVGGSEVANGAAEAAVEEPLSEVHTSDGQAMYIAPHLRLHEGSESEERSQVRRRVRGLLNRLSETNVESITGEIFTVIQSVGRSAGCQIICDEVLASCLNGPRGNEQHAAVFATFIAGMACLVGIDFSAKLIASLAKSFEGQLKSLRFKSSTMYAARRRFSA